MIQNGSGLCITCMTGKNTQLISSLVNFRVVVATVARCVCRFLAPSMVKPWLLPERHSLACPDHYFFFLL